ncbi:hypothetical protein BDY17DRAFT_117059 [Neohortaea acidophila]|uniref:Uncharacterized protein n=1 Tax=Neohortaea acidophila TaxID=245834 RepID=A0A6A6PUS5_9PEZI|nr:uncharacterized protein BDY17DRAFT_117059 [Neohortaea acidophila]KAF2483868.1 hypothetical protein BDY17DRAFT_117059 [Neohortaea acidophila]
MPFVLCIKPTSLTPRARVEEAWFRAFSRPRCPHGRSAVQGWCERRWAARRLGCFSTVLAIAVIYPCRDCCQTGKRGQSPLARNQVAHRACGAQKRTAVRAEPGGRNKQCAARVGEIAAPLSSDGCIHVDERYCSATTRLDRGLPSNPRDCRVSS